MTALLGLFRKLSIASALIVGWLIVLLLFVGWLIFAYDQAEAWGFINYVTSSIAIISQPPEALDVGSVLRLAFASLSALFALILCVFTFPMFAFVYTNVAYGKAVEKLNKPRETVDAEAEVPGA